VDERELAWHEAMALRDLQHHATALPHFERSVAATPATETRSQYLHRAFLLQAQIDVRSWSDAETTILTLRPLVAEVASTRTHYLLGRIAEDLRNDPTVPGSFVAHAEQLDRELKSQQNQEI
jgi:hypothetical protein